MIPSLNQPTDLQFNIHFPKVEAMALNSSCFLSLPSSVRRNHRVPLRIFAYHFCILLLFGAADICQRIALFQTELHSVEILLLRQGLIEVLFFLASGIVLLPVANSEFSCHKQMHIVNVYLWELVVVRLLPNFRNEVMKMVFGHLRALLRHSITLWIYLPLQMIAEEFAEDQSQLPVLGQITSQNQKLQDGYATADAPISLQSM
ncbi:hypothetical protein SDJN02_19719 [Cucurbita argyrosperma subsp. argyrosperma]|nr:hypothetical protein SDJN02_19719 [Cucurbita argyrosperma subsp. argyrosperma]